MDVRDKPDKRRSRSGGFAWIGLALAVLVASTPAHSQSLAGSWRGFVEQQNASSLARQTSYFVSMVLDGAGGGYIDYPSLGCGGRLQYLGVSGAGYLFRERLTYGVTVCLDSGTVIVVPHDNKVRWSWFGKDGHVAGELAGPTRMLEHTCAACGGLHLRGAETCKRTGDMFAQNRCVDQVTAEWRKCTHRCRP